MLQEPFLLVGLFNWNMSFHFRRVFPLIADWSVWRNESTLVSTCQSETRAIICNFLQGILFVCVCWLCAHSHVAKP